jgi:hypothetical protein
MQEAPQFCSNQKCAPSTEFIKMVGMIAQYRGDVLDTVALQKTGDGSFEKEL